MEVLEHYIYNPLSRFTSGKFWKLKLTTLLITLSIFFASGPFFFLKQAFELDNWKSFNFKKENILKQPPFNPISHAAKKTFRITVPLIAKVAHLNNWATVVFEWLLNVLFIYMCIELFLAISADKIVATLGTVGITFIYAGRAGLVDISTWFDGVAYYFLLLSLFCTNRIYIFALLLLAYFTDERAYFSSIIVFFFHLYKNDNQASLFDFKKNVTPLLIFSSAVLGILIRLFLQYNYGLQTQTGGTYLKQILDHSDFWGMSFWTMLEGFWALIFLLLLILIHHKNYFQILVLVGIVALFFLGSTLVFDKTRTGGYMFPIIFLALVLIQKHLQLAQLRNLFFICAVISFLFPAYYIIADTAPYTHWYKPLFIRAVDFYNAKFVH